MFYHQHFIFVDIYLEGPMHFYLGPIIILTKKLKIAVDVVVFIDGPMHFSELSQPLKSLKCRRRFKFWQKSHLHNSTLYNERKKSVVRWQRNLSNILNVISINWVTMFWSFFSFNEAFEWLKNISRGLRVGLLSRGTPSDVFQHVSIPLTFEDPCVATLT
jgi:hypothetical protein